MLEAFEVFFQLYSNGKNSADYLPIFKNETYFNTWFTLKILEFHTTLARNRRKKKRKKKKYRTFKCGNDTLSFMSSCIWVYQNKASPKTDSFLNSNSTLCLPFMFIHFTTCCDSDSNQHCSTKVFVSVCACSHSSTGPALRTSALQPVATTGEGTPQSVQEGIHPFTAAELWQTWSLFTGTITIQ